MNSDQEKKKINNYIEEIKNNINFFIGLGGFISILAVFHYSVFEVRKTEVLGTNIDQLNESIFVKSIRDSLEFVVTIIGIIGIVMVATYIVRKNLFNDQIIIKDKPLQNNDKKSIVILMISAIFLIVPIAYFMDFHLSISKLDTIGSFSLLIIFIELQFVITVINYIITTKNYPTHSEIDFQVIVQLVYIGIMIFAFLLPFLYFNLQATRQDSVVLTKSLPYILVEKEKDKVVLRKIERVGGNGSEYRLGNEYITRNAKNYTFVELKINNLKHVNDEVRINSKEIEKIILKNK